MATRTMTGKVRGGQVVVDRPIDAADETPVTITVSDGAADPAVDGHGPPPTLAEALRDVIGKAEGLPSGGARNYREHLNGTRRQ